MCPTILALMRRIACSVVAAALLAPGASRAEPVPPRPIKIAALTCGELLAAPPELRDRMLIYFNGVLDGYRKATVWNPAVVGKRIDQVMSTCQRDPKSTVLKAFQRAWARPASKRAS